MTLLVLPLATALFGCSDAAEFGTRRGEPGDSLNAVSSPADSSTSASPSSSTVTTALPVPSATTNEVGDPFNEVRCPEQAQRIESTECDPLAEQTQCPAGEGCFPYVDYPTSRCEPETFGTRCAPAGAGMQGDPCAGERCAHGFLCVVTSRGTECARLCRMPGPNTCPDGFICGSLDIDGFGVCI